MITKKIWWRVIIALLLAVAAGGYWGWYSEYNQVTALKLRIIELQKQELRSAIDKSVSEQLEVIASQQKNIAEEKTIDIVFKMLILLTYDSKKLIPSFSKFTNILSIKSI